MRVFLGGVFGAAAAAVAWMAIEHSTKQEFGWMAIVVGFVTGLAVHWAAGADSQGSYARGALAAVLALIACVGCRQVYAKIMVKANTGAVAVVAGASGEPDEAEPSELKMTEEESEQAAESTKLVLSFEDQSVSGAAGSGNISFKKGLTQWDMLWLSMAALAAYVVGKGRDRVVANDVVVESPDEPV